MFFNEEIFWFYEINNYATPYLKKIDFITMNYKKFNIDNSEYIFCAEDFEILKIPHVKNIEKILHEIKDKKSISNIDKGKNLEDDFANNKIINAIAINLANGCNLDCSYCYILSSNKSKGLLSKVIFLDLLDFLKSKKNHPITFYFTGVGEPTLNFTLLKQVPHLCRENRFNDCAFELMTNGTILTKEMVKFFKLNKFTLYISMDGNESVHNVSRKYHNGEGSFKDVFNNINVLKENYINFSCKTVIQPDNKNLVEVFLFFEENKIKFSFNIATNSFDNHFLPNIENLKTFEKQLNIVIRNYKKLIAHNHKIYATKLINDLKRIHYGAVSKNGCLASKKSFFMDIDGSLYPCSYHTSSKELSVGDIYNGIDYEKIIENDWFAKPVDSYLASKNCWMKYLCSGSCFAIKWLENKNTDEPSEYLCKTYNIYWSAIIKLYIQLYPIIVSGKNINFLENEKKSYR